MLFVISWVPCYSTILLPPYQDQHSILSGKVNSMRENVKGDFTESYGGDEKVDR